MGQIGAYFMVKNINELNAQLHSNCDEFIASCNNDFYNHIKQVAQTIEKNIEKTPLILLSGPSGSGKTTTALMIENLLDNKGLETHTLSLDNYFKPLSDDDKILLGNGRLDLESPTRVDTDLLNSQLEKMINCESVELPKYNFAKATRERSGRILERKHNEPVILEGIHSLNPSVIQIPDEATLKIYVSVRTRVQYGNITLHPSYIRLLRRMMRDSLFRGRSIEDTLKMFTSVNIGEEQYIMPFKCNSDIDIDTFIPYELSVYKPFLNDKLAKIEKEGRIQDMARVLSATESVDEDKVPKNSLIREFIGNSEFDY